MLFPTILDDFALVVLVRAEVQMAGLSPQLRNILNIVIGAKSIYISLFALFLFKEFSKKRTCISERALRSFVGFLVLFLDFYYIATILRNHIGLCCYIHILRCRIIIHFYRTTFCILGTSAHCFHLFVGTININFTFEITDFFVNFLDSANVGYCLPLSCGLLWLELVVGKPASVLINVLGLLCVFFFLAIASIIIYLILHFLRSNYINLKIFWA